jgi:endonuclease/exonuclease/phosphatase family metal-dependent hydrolase
MRIRVATFNVWGLPEPFSSTLLARMEAIGRRLATLGVDVISFQEVWTGDARRALRLAGERAGLIHAWHNRVSFGGSGLLVLSRLPIEAARFEPFRLAGHPHRLTHPDYYGGKGYVEVRLATRAGGVTLVATHLHARYSSDVAHEYVAHRTGQIVQLSRAAQRLGSPLVVVGDFNFTDDQPEHDVVTGLPRLRDVAAELGRRDATVLRENPFRAGSGRPDRRIDYVFVRDGRRQRVVGHSIRRIFDETLSADEGPAGYSDHAGLLAELEIQPGAPTRSSAPERSAIELASRLLANGRVEALARRRDGRALAGAGLAAATVAAVGVRQVSSVSRRRLLRGALQGAALLTLAPTAGFSILSELSVPSELAAFDDLQSYLAGLSPGAV